MLLLSWDALSSYSETLLLMSIRQTATHSDKAWANTSVSASFHPSSSGRLCPREYVADAREKTGMPGPIASRTRRATSKDERIWFARLPTYLTVHMFDEELKNAESKSRT